MDYQWRFQRQAFYSYWGSCTTTKSRKFWQSILITNAYCLSNDKPTSWRSDQSKILDCIDIFISRTISANYIEINNIEDLSSDHLAIVLTFGNTILHKQAAPKLTNKFTDWEVFHDTMNKNMNLHVQLKTPRKLE